MAEGRKRRRFRNVHSVRSYVSRVLIALEDSTDAGNVEAARVKLYGAKVMAELIQRTEIEDRVTALEKKNEPKADGEQPSSPH